MSPTDREGVTGECPLTLTLSRTGERGGKRLALSRTGERGS
jgi:hypothetical protein